ncbi:unknown protein [Oryza sativa Japonica Group]|uniref:Uncharacterized protein n=1 Tax=Oryza sativa subsp. japonica TaxID=39947 RepID=Q656Y9_ORYSJ|nr:unknown protein [Oryza sativa Japonica Group]
MGETYQSEMALGFGQAAVVIPAAGLEPSHHVQILKQEENLDGIEPGGRDEEAGKRLSGIRWWSEWRSPSGQNSSLPFLPNGAAAARMGAQATSAAWYGSGGEEDVKSKSSSICVYRVSAVRPAASGGQTGGKRRSDQRRRQARQATSAVRPEIQHRSDRRHPLGQTDRSISVRPISVDFKEDGVVVAGMSSVRERRGVASDARRAATITIDADAASVGTPGVRGAREEDGEDGAGAS